MINYIRTGLWNRQHVATTFFRNCDLFVPQNFRPIVDPPILAAFRKALFGTAPDSAFFVYRTHNVLTALHTSYYRRYMFDWDGRLTYDLQDPVLSKLFITDIQSFGEQPVRAEGEVSVLEDVGICSAEFTVQSDFNSGEIAFRNLANTQTATLTRTTVFAVPNTSLRLILPSQIAFSANIYSATQPTKNWADIVLDVNHSHAKDVAKHVFASSNDGPLAELRAAYYGESDATEQFTLLCFAVARYTALRSLASQ